MRSGYFVSLVEQERISGLDKPVVPTVSVTFSKQELWRARTVAVSSYRGI